MIDPRRPSRPPIADSLVRLPDGRVRIASATPKAGWNASVTIGIDGQWFEVECEDQAQLPHSHVYVLRPAPPGKILRGYQEYDVPSAMNASSTVEPSTGTDLS